MKSAIRQPLAVEARFSEESYWQEGVRRPFTMRRLKHAASSLAAHRFDDDIAVGGPQKKDPDDQDAREDADRRQGVPSVVIFLKVLGVWSSSG